MNRRWTSLKAKRVTKGRDRRLQKERRALSAQECKNCGEVQSKRNRVGWLKTLLETTYSGIGLADGLEGLLVESLLDLCIRGSRPTERVRILNDVAQRAAASAAASLLSHFAVQSIDVIHNLFLLN